MQTALDIHPMDEIKNQLSKIMNVIPPGSNVYYIDYPIYNNGGDLLIMKGTEAFFREHQIHVRARYSVFDFPDGLIIPKDHIIVLQGGGNFGDLYPIHQKLREKIVIDYPFHRIVILPQTIFYEDEAEYDRTAELFNRHKDVHLYVRDTLTYQVAIEKFHSCCVYLAPDMAHQLWPIRTRSNPGKELLCFYRTDIERLADQEQLESQSGGDQLDWATLYNRAEKKSISLMVRMIKNGNGALPIQSIWSKYSDYLVDKAIKRFSGYRAVETSRLHGHILSCLLDKPNTLLDNAYGKNSNYYYTWTSCIGNVRLHANTKL